MNKTAMKAECFFRAVINEETSAAIADKFAMKRSSVHNIVLSLGKHLCHPVWDDGTPQRALDASETNFASLRAKKDVYLTRLRRWMKRHSLSDIPKEFTIRLPSQPNTTQVWTATAEALLGTASDEQVALRLGVSPKSVRSRRLELKIQSFGGGGLDPNK